MIDLKSNQIYFFHSLFRREPVGDELERTLRALDRLSDRDRDVLRFRYGLDGASKRSLEEVSSLTKMTRERVRQIESIASNRLIRDLSFPETNPIVPDAIPGKWVLAQDGKETIYSTFEDAVEAFRSQIQEHMQLYKECYFSGMPFDVGSFFEGREENQITDEEVMVLYRLTNLLSCLVADSASVSTYMSLRCLDPVNRSFSYSDMDFYSSDILSVDVQEDSDEIRVKLQYGEADDVTYLFTNAFSFMNPGIDYYFDSHQVILCGARDRLGMDANLRVCLKKAE